MKLLWLSKLHPQGNGYGGDLLYSSGLINACRMQGAEVKALGYAKDWRQIMATVDTHWMTFPLPSRLAGSHLFSTLPSTAARYVSMRYTQAVQNCLREEWDGVIIDSIAMGWIISLLENCHVRAPIVYLSHNDETSWRREYVKAFTGLKRLALSLDARKAAHLEKCLCQAANVISAITASDAEAYRKRHPQKTVIVSLPGYKFPSTLPSDACFGPKREVVILGSFHWSAKQHNLLHFLAQSRSLLSGAQIKIKIIGDMPKKFKEHLTNIHPELDIIGKVDKFEDHLSSARIGLIIDEIGGGFKLKSLDYVSQGIPIITLRGAMQGMPLVANHDFLSSETMKELGFQIIELIDDRTRLLTMRRSSFEKCVKAFSWEDSARQFLHSIAGLQSGSSQLVQ